MDKPAKYKSKNKKPAAKPKTTKKRKQSDGPTCSMFLAEITRKLAAKRRQIDDEDIPKNIVHMIIESLTNALPVIFSRKSPEKKNSIPDIQNLAPELLPNDLLEIPCPMPEESSTEVIQEVAALDNAGFKMPKMPLVSSEVIKMAIEKRKKMQVMVDASTDTADEHDMASELVKHVGTLRKISLIAEEFNQKTAKNLKEIVDSVQEDLIKKLEEFQAEQKAAVAAEADATEVKQTEDVISEDISEAE